MSNEVILEWKDNAPEDSEVSKAIHDNRDEFEELADESAKEITLENGWKFTLEKTRGGYEGGGSEYWVVLRLDIHGEFNSYWKIDGYYESYYGRELSWSDVTRCKPKVVTVVDWT